MKLSSLVASLDLHSCAPASAVDPEVRGLCYDSRICQPGDLFVAWRGEKSDGREFAASAIDSGAVGVVSWAPPSQEMKASYPETPFFESENPREVLGHLAARLYGHPDAEVSMIAITGTNGKTSTAFIVEHLLAHCGRAPGRIGTQGAHFREQKFELARTTPEGSDLFRILREMVASGADSVVMEASSHALAQGRIAAASFNVAAFSNLSRDHFDFHGDLESYFEAKARLFDLVAPGGTAVINVDDAWGRKLSRRLEERADLRCLTAGQEGLVRYSDPIIDERGIRFGLETPRGRTAIESRLFGGFNLDNLMLALAIGEALALPLDGMANAVASLSPVPGRLEVVDQGQAFPVMIDYAHTDAGLKAVLGAVRQVTDRKIALVFGCGGDRDVGKRPLMGKTAGELADLPIVTDDNPRSEDPHAIHSAIEEGLKQSGNRKYKIIPDRREAIRKAIAIARARDNWLVLIAGKGDESEQNLGDRVVPFSDLEEATRALLETEESLGQPVRG